MDIPRRPGEAVSYAVSGERLEVVSMTAGGSKIPGVVQKRGSKTMGARARSGVGRDLPFTFFVSEILDGLEREGS